MAVDGRKLRDTLRLGSDDWIEFPCSPCKKDDKNVASMKHCVECGENQCKMCLSYHEKFTRGHQIVENPRANIEQKKPELPIQRCEKHGGKLVDVYCPSHDVVGCSTCIAIDHGNFQRGIIETSKNSEKDDKNVASTKHCIECGENLCKTCLSYHEKFTRGHQIVKNPRPKTQQTKPELPVQRCDKHGGKLVDVYCPGHDVVGCSTCVAIDHGSCKGKQFIPDVVKSSTIAKKMSKLDSSMEQLLAQLDKLKHDKQDRLRQLHKEKNDILMEIEYLRTKINVHLDQMEKTLVSDVESRFAEKIQSTNQCVESYNNIASSVVKSRNILQGAGDINDADMFVQIKQGKENLSEHERKMKLFSSEGEMRFKLFPNSLKDVLFGEKGNIFSRISETIIPKSIEHFGDFSVRLQSDKQTCMINEFCLTTNGSIVCTDGSNNKLKKMDRCYNEIEHLDMPSTPACLCEVDSTQLAVTLIDDKKVQFVCQVPLKLSRCFTVRDRCRGIDCHDGKLYVCCGGFKNEGPGHIEVYDLQGALLRTLREGMIKPFHIKAVSDDGIFVGDNRGSSRKLFRVNKHDFSVSEIHIKTLTDVRIFCRIGDGQLCIPGSKSNNVVLISDVDELQQELLTVKDGIVNPYSVFFNETQSQLVVGFEDSDTIKVYHVIT